MLVDAELAKEKLAREISERMDISEYTLREVIRNTDLTDCQRPARMCPVSYRHLPHDTCDGTPAPDQGSVRNATELARLFHDTYERLAPSFGYVTRTDTRQFDPDSPNGRLMIAVCAAIRALPDQKD